MNRVGLGIKMNIGMLQLTVVLCLQEQLILYHLNINFFLPKELVSTGLLYKLSWVICNSFLAFNKKQMKDI